MSALVAEGSEGRLGSGWMINILSVVLGLAIIVAVGGFIYMSALDRHDKEYLALTSEQQILSQTLAKFALSASAGDAEAFLSLAKARQRFAATVELLEHGGADGDLPALPQSLGEDLARVRRHWGDLYDTTSKIVQAREEILAVGEIVHAIQDLMPELQSVSDEIIQLLVRGGVDSKQVFLATRQLMLAQRIENNVSRVLAGGEDAAAAADRFGNDAALFGRVLQGMLRGAKDIGVKAIKSSQAQGKLKEIALLFGSISDRAGRILEVAPTIVPAQLAAKDVAGVSDAVTRASANLSERIEAGHTRPTVVGISIDTRMVAVPGAIALIMLVVISLALVGAARRREAASMSQNTRNQEAILKLLDEMGDLADGDLTVKATVTEDITGAIADSMNYAIEALRSLVATINRTSAEVSSSAQGARATAMHLAEASEHQAQQIRTAGEAVGAIANSAGQISQNSEESSDVAKKSVDAASQGAGAVRKTIESMDSIREQIQETSKRIKRLGESSQEIGNIVELIEDIADQTNILALNAAMQAAMAGEAGRGFAVVADEVQRLAERSGNATKQIEALVKTIQTDTHEAVISMEHSTAGVVNGAKLAEESGESLKEIEGVSTYIAELVQGISDSARRQAAEVSSISDTMKVIQEITQQTTDGTNNTAESIGNLAELSEELQRSVSGFRLPG